MLIQQQFYKQYQSNNPEQFNNKFIYQRNETHIPKTVECLEDLCKALEIITGVYYIGCEVVTNEIEINTLLNRTNKSIKENRYILITIHFRLEAEDLVKDISIPILFPKLVDDFYYKLNGSKYTAIYQLIDNGTYNTKDCLTLKTLLMPIHLSYKDIEREDLVGNTLVGREIKLNLFRKDINILYYYMGKKGFLGTLEYFNIPIEAIKLFEKIPAKELKLYKETHYLFKIATGKSLAIKKEVYEANHNVFITLLEFIYENKPTIENLNDNEFWKIKLGKIFSKNPNSYIDAGDSILRSLERIMDGRTKKNLIQVLDKDKDDIYAIIRWMMYFFDELRNGTNTNLANKRLRLEEYLILPFIIKCSEATYRVFNSKKTTMKRLEQIFSNIPPDFCIKKILTNRLLRYINNTNTADIFNGLKLSQVGDSGLSSDSKTKISLNHRNIDPSYINRLGLVASSSSDPGASYSIVPFVDIKENYYFDTEVKYITPY